VHIYFSVAWYVVTITMMNVQAERCVLGGHFDARRFTSNKKRSTDFRREASAGFTSCLDLLVFVSRKVGFGLFRCNLGTVRHKAVCQAISAELFVWYKQVYPFLRTGSYYTTTINRIVKIKIQL
jgi:hypothetical protein